MNPMDSEEVKKALRENTPTLRKVFEEALGKALIGAMNEEKKAGECSGTQIELPFVMTVDDLTALLRINKTRFYGLRSQGLIPPSFTLSAGGRPMWLREKILEWLREKAEAAERRANRIR